MLVVRPAILMDLLLTGDGHRRVPLKLLAGCAFGHHAAGFWSFNCFRVNSQALVVIGNQQHHRFCARIVHVLGECTSFFGAAALLWIIEVGHGLPPPAAVIFYVDSETVVASLFEPVCK